MRYELIAQREAQPDRLMAKGGIGGPATVEDALAIMTSKVEELEEAGRWPEGFDAAVRLDGVLWWLAGDEWELAQ
jgi:hypothetical protein